MTDPRKILFLDIETRPSLVYTWGFWGVNISPDKIVTPGGVMSIAWSWDGEKQVHFADEREDDLAAIAYELLDRADVIVTYNGNKFDLPHLHRLMTLAGMTNPSPYVSVDLFAVVKREQRGVWPSLKLGYLLQELELAEKLKTDGFQMWLDCMAGDTKAWNKMKRYNLQDVRVLKELFALIRHKVKNLPSASLYMDSNEQVCPNCASTDFQSRGIQRNKTRAYRRFFCNGCSTWFRGNTSISSAEVTVV